MTLKSCPCRSNGLSPEHYCLHLRTAKRSESTRARCSPDHVKGRPSQYQWYGACTNPFSLYLMLLLISVDRNCFVISRLYKLISFSNSLLLTFELSLARIAIGHISSISTGCLIYFCYLNIFFWYLSRVVNFFVVVLRTYNNISTYIHIST